MRAFLSLLLIGAGACASAPSQTTTAAAPARDSASADIGRGATSLPNADPFPSTYTPFPSRTTVIRNVNILTAAGPLIRNGAILMQNGKIAAVGAAVSPPADALVIDGGGKYVTPGIIDDHSHLGVYAAPGGNALSDGNEATNPTTPQVWAEHSVWPQDPQFPRNLAGGVTTLQVLPGSAKSFDQRLDDLSSPQCRCPPAFILPQRRRRRWSDANGVVVIAALMELHDDVDITNLGDVIWVGGDRRAVARMGMRSASTFADALEMASDTVGRSPSITYLHSPPHALAHVT